MKRHQTGFDPKELQALMSEISPISTQTIEALLPATKLISLKKDDLLEREKEKIRYQFIVQQGVVRAYLTDFSGQESTIAFFTCGMAVTPTLMRSVDYHSFINLQVASKNAKVFLFSNEIMDKQMQGVADLQAFGFKVMMKDSFLRAQRERMLLTFPAKDRLNWFRKTYPNLENEIPHHYIASYLGITPTSLSRLRGAKNK